ncbi:hypothetical protein BB561_006416 [Smittium simulii]|uniref:Exonuclease domain-containing protein n=1 Tax=Smittium simulii TaxID=133385 RepID=A0A2T9Y4I0_9FUNG|nr:hypothetical protein BB561_006416 [Smittium simulii]
MKAGTGTMVWIDCEMTGLDPEQDHLLEIAVVITSNNINKILETLELVIHQPDDILDNMNSWCIEHHGESGLTKKVRESDISLEQAEQLIIELILRACDQNHKPLIAGNTVHADLAFLKKYMPNMVKLLHYRIIDVSSIKELMWKWLPNTARKAPAMDDILESIEELKYYKKKLFSNVKD